MLTRRKAVTSIVVAGVTALLCGMALGTAAQAVDTPGGKPAAPTDLKVHWAGTDANGHPTGAVLTWNAVPGATSYNIYRAFEIAPRPAGDTILLEKGVKDTFFVDGSVSMGVDSIPVYQVTAVNAAGESAKSNKAAPGLPGADTLVVIQGNVVQSNGKPVLVKTTGPANDSITYEVDLSHALFEAANGTPTASVKLTIGQAVVVVGHKDSSLGAGVPHPMLHAQVVELADKAK
ncbi:MAG: hypothetical protein JO316_16955 [Abitibacteriaceae bacterium]|nr:hypothetical protein [Abditibacteriaceae bacterium]MBV9867045.1 hypothetical protein [Abditibacteriaceae bacterium]